MEQSLQRNYFQVAAAATPHVFSNWPINHAGAALHVFNASPDTNAVVTIEESDDGATWTTVTFSTITAAAALNLTVVPQALGSLLFVSISKFVRVSLTADIPEQLFCHLSQWMPTNPEFDGGYA